MAAAVAVVPLAVLAVMLLLQGSASAISGDTVADRVFGQGGSFTSGTCNLGGNSASSLCIPYGGAAVDAAGRLYIVDQGNHRVLENDSPLTSSVADRVFGQGGSFTSGTCNNGGVSASSLCNPLDVAVDAAGRLYVVDDSNSRVLEYDSPLTSSVANRVFGQGGSFTASTCNNGGVSASSLCYPAGVAVDATGRLYVADNDNNRVLEYDSPLTSSVANRVFGQGGSFTSGTCNLGGISASSLCVPIGAAVDAAGNVYVADYFNMRVLEYNQPLATDTVADQVFGQGGSFTSSTCNLGGISASSVCYPVDVAADATGRLYVAEHGNNRVLEYDQPLTTDTMADQVFGQGGSFTSGTCNLGGISASSLCDPFGVAVDGLGNVYIADPANTNNRVLEYDTPAGPLTPTPTNTATDTPTSTPTDTSTPLPIITPLSVGGISLDPQLPSSSGGSSGLLGVTAGVTAGVLSLAAAAWYTRKRRLR